MLRESMKKQRESNFLQAFHFLGIHPFFFFKTKFHKNKRGKHASVGLNVNSDIVAIHLSTIGSKVLYSNGILKLMDATYNNMSFISSHKSCFNDENPKMPAIITQLSQGVRSFHFCFHIKRFFFCLL